MVGAQREHAVEARDRLVVAARARSACCRGCSAPRAGPAAWPARDRGSPARRPGGPARAARSRDWRGARVIRLTASACAIRSAAPADGRPGRRPCPASEARRRGAANGAVLRGRASRRGESPPLVRAWACAIKVSSVGAGRTTGGRGKTWDAGSGFLGHGSGLVHALQQGAQPALSPAARGACLSRPSAPWPGGRRPSARPRRSAATSRPSRAGLVEGVARAAQRELLRHDDHLEAPPRYWRSRFIARSPPSGPGEDDSNAAGWLAVAAMPPPPADVAAMRDSQSNALSTSGVGNRCTRA